MTDLETVEFLQNGGIKLRRDRVTYLTFEDNEPKQEIWLLDQSKCDQSIIVADVNTVSRLGNLMRQFNFTALKEGTCTITALLAKPWEVNLDDMSKSTYS